MKEYEWDKKLKIDTYGRIDGHADEYHYPYEPTPYAVLERLAQSEYILAEDIVIDYGCGKGRVSFFLNHVLGCHTIGVEYDRKLHQKAAENKHIAHRKQVEFVCENAENYEVHNANIFYFFNPFSVEVLRKVIGRIKESFYNNPRVMKLFFYYPNDEYVAYLMTEYELELLDEIDCQDLFVGKNHRERILIFEMG